MTNRRQFLRQTSAGLATLALATQPGAQSHGQIANRGVTKESIRAGIGRGKRFLSERQSEDGGWRSTACGPYEDGTALTEHVLRTLQELGGANGMIEKGVSFMRLRWPTVEAREERATPADLGAIPNELSIQRLASLVECLLQRQQPDGSWINASIDFQEHDPLVATPWALSALRTCLIRLS